MWATADRAILNVFLLRTGRVIDGHNDFFAARLADVA